MRKRLLSGLLAVSMMFSLCPASAFADDTGGGVLIPDAVSMQEVDTENDAADPQYTQVFKVADTASEADGTVTFADAVNAINQDTSGNYLIELADNITLPDTHFVIKANTTILGENHTIHFGAEPIDVYGTGTVLNLGREDYTKTLTLTGGTGKGLIGIYDSGIFSNEEGAYVLNLYDGVTFEDNYPSLGVILIGNDSTMNMYGNSCIKAASDITLVDGRTVTSAVLNMYDTSCLDGCNISAFGYDHGTGALNMYDQSTIKNFILRKNYTQTWYAVRAANCTMNDNSRIENCGGGGIKISSPLYYLKSTFTMNGGSITNCSDGGVLLRDGSSFTMNGGSITNCSARTNGGGVYADGSYGSFTMNGGSITGCSATNGGGIYMAGYQCTFTMNGGSITDCSAKNSGGGIYVSGNYNGGLSMNSGSITGCSAAEGGGIYLSPDASLTSKDGFVLCNNTATTYGADAHIRKGSKLPSAASMNAVYNADGKGRTITGWYEDDSSTRYSPENYSREITNNDLSSRDYALVASYQDENIHTITIAKDAEGNTPGYAYLKDETTGSQTTITGTIPGKKVYLSYENGNTLDRWEAEPDTVEIHPATETKDAWFEMPDYNVTISCKDHYEASTLATDIDKRSILAKKPAEFTVTVAANNDTNDDFNGVLMFDDTTDIETLEFFGEDSEEWSTLNYDATLDGYPFVEQGQLNSTTYRFRVTFKQAGAHTLSAALYAPDNTDADYCSFENVPFTVKDQITVDMSALDPKPEDPQINGYDPARDENDKLLAGAGDTLAFTKPDGADENLIYKLVDEDGNETEIPLVDGKYTIELPGNCSITQEVKAPDPVVPDTDDTGSAIGAGIATGVFVSGATYLIGTNIWLNAIYDFVPTNRIQLAVALWNKADCPAPVSTELYPDIDADDTDAQAAARWCVEQGLMKDYHETDKDGNEEVTFKPYRYMFRPQAIKAWYDLEALQREQQ